AIECARQLIQGADTETAVVDLAPVSVQMRSDGAMKFLSPLFSRKERFPASGDPSGILRSASAAEQLPASQVQGLASGRARLAAGPAVATPTLLQIAASALVGRDDVLRMLVDSARWAIGERKPGIATVIADAGYGKSRLCAALRDQLGHLSRTL